MSRSPSANQVGSAPYSRNSSPIRQLSPVRPQPRSASAAPASVYITLSRSGQIRRPCRVTSSPVLTIAVTWSARPAPVANSRTPCRNRAPPTPPARTVIRTTAEPTGSLPTGRREGPSAGQHPEGGGPPDRPEGSPHAVVGRVIRALRQPLHQPD